MEKAQITKKKRTAISIMALRRPDLLEKEILPPYSAEKKRN